MFVGHEMSNLSGLNCLRFRSHNVGECLVAVTIEHLLPDGASVSGGAMSVKENTF